MDDERSCEYSEITGGTYRILCSDCISFSCQCACIHTAQASRHLPGEGHPCEEKDDPSGKE